MTTDGKVLRLVQDTQRTRIGDGFRELADLADRGEVTGAVTFHTLGETQFGVRLLGQIRLSELLEAFERFKLRQLRVAEENER